MQLRYRRNLMNSILAQFKDEELTAIGRAMERGGFTDIHEFIRWAANQQTDTILAEK